MAKMNATYKKMLEEELKREYNKNGELPSMIEIKLGEDWLVSDDVDWCGSKVCLDEIAYCNHETGEAEHMDRVFVELEEAEAEEPWYPSDYLFYNIY